MRNFSENSNFTLIKPAEGQRSLPYFSQKNCEYEDKMFFTRSVFFVIIARSHRALVGEDKIGAVN